MELFILALFSLGLITCLAFDISVLVALAFGYLLFFSYGLWKHFSCQSLLKLSWEGIKTVRMILIAFVFIGMLTASWRACGTIPTIIYYSSTVMIPAVFLLITFLLNCFVSVLTGTSFGTMATIGVICMTIGNIMGINPAFLGGATLSGIYFGDRCSPMSTSALLVSTLTRTDLYTNIKLMVKTAFIPFIITCVIYLLMGFISSVPDPDLHILELFHTHFNLSLFTLTPALLIILFSGFRINVIKSMAASTLLAAVICFFLQDFSVKTIAIILLTGYHAESPQLAMMLDGGGITSMFTVGAIVCLSASYFGIFDKTGLLRSIEKNIITLTRRIGIFGSAIFISIGTSMIACNQSLASMLSYQLCKPIERDRQRLVILLSDTVVVIAPLIPWNISGAVPLETLGAPVLSIIFAFYLFLVPLWNLFINFRTYLAGNKQGI